MATDPTNYLYSLLAQNSGQFGQYFAQGQQEAAQDQSNQQALAESAMKIQALRQDAATDQQFQQDMQAWHAAGSPPDGFQNLVYKYPKYSQQLVDAHKYLDDAQAKGEQTFYGGVYSAALNGRTDLVASQLQQRERALKAAGQDTSSIDDTLAQLNADPKAGLANVKSYALSQIYATNPADFMKAFGIDGDKDKGFTLDAGQTRYDGNGNVIASAGPKEMEAFHYTLKDAAGNEHEYIYDPDSGQPLPPGATPAPGAAGAASVIGQDGKLDPVAFYKQFVLPHEGGYAAHDANGAPVNHGINQSANPGVDVKNLSTDDAAQIFASKYFPSSANLPPALAAVNADTAFINPARAAQFLQASGGDPTKYMGLRKAWMNGLISKQPDKYGQYADAWATRNADLSAYAQNLSGGASSAGPAVSGGMPTGQISGSRQIDPNPVNNTAVADMPGNPNKQGDDYLASLPAGIRSTVKAIAGGNMAQPSSFALTKPYWQQVMAAVAQYDPTFDSSTQPARVAAAKAFTGNGKAAQTLASIDRLSYHINDLYRDSQALTGWNLGPASSLFNAGVQSFQKAALARYNAALPFIAGELQKLTKNGSASEGESKQIMANLDPTQPASARLAGMQQLAELTQGQFKPIRNQWASAFPDGRPMPMDISNEANTILDNLENDKGPVAIDPHTGRLAGRSNSAPTNSSTPLEPPAGAIQMLRSNPRLAQQFDQKYGLGSAARVLGR